MKIKQSVINTLNRIGIDYLSMLEHKEVVTVLNRFGGGSCETSYLVSRLIAWVYNTSRDYEEGIQKVRIDDFDRVRYFILSVDKNAYMTCID